MNGKGIYCFNSGIYIEGSFSQNLVNGLACLQYPDGSFIKGDFSDGQLNGLALAYDSIQDKWHLKEYSADGTIEIIFEGQGEPVGYGIFNLKYALTVVDYATKTRNDKLGRFAKLVNGNIEFQVNH